MLCKVTRNSWNPPSSDPPREAATLAAIQSYWNCTTVLQRNHLCLHAQTWAPQAKTHFYTSALALIRCSCLLSCSVFEQRYCAPYKAAETAEYFNTTNALIQTSLPGRLYTGCSSKDPAPFHFPDMFFNLDTNCT